jgi:P pilus assembly chaperone PapD
MQIGKKNMAMPAGAKARAGTLWLAALMAASPASAELVVSQLVVDFKAGAPRAADIEVFNNGDERNYVAVEPSEVLRPGTPQEARGSSPDPGKLGLLASPARFILEPQQRRTLRIAAIGPGTDGERVYRVTVKPVAGDVSGDATGLKLLVGYDLLVLVRPAAIRTEVKAERNGTNLTLSNNGNASVELSDGKQCDANGKSCQALPAKRLYAGASWKQKLPGNAGGEYRIRSAEGWSTLKF